MKQLICVAILLLCCSTVYAQGGVLEMDAVGYRLDSTHAEVELYYGIVRRALDFSQSGKIWTAPINARAELWSGATIVGAKDITSSITFQGTKSDLDSASATKALGGAAFVIPYAPSVQAKLIWHSRLNGKDTTTTLTKLIALPVYVGDRVSMSGIELSSSITKSDGQTNPFEKAGFIVLPNPSNVYGDLYNKLYYYTEFYVPRSIVDPSKNVDVVSKIIDGSGHEIQTVSRKQALLAGTIPFLGSLDIDGLPGDTYKLQISVKDEGAIIAQQEKTFYFESGMKLSEEEQQPAVTSNEDNIYLASDFAKWKDADIDLLFQQTMQVMADADRKDAKKITDPAAKRKFIFSFWRRNDQGNTKPLASYDLFKKRLAEADKQFTYQRTPGWKTDRGRIYLKYGPPDVVGGEAFASESKPYITWEYYDQSIRINPVAPNMPSTASHAPTGSRPFFIFLDRQGGGVYVLEHSNVIGEVPQPDWYSRDAHRLN